jgi:hypothetical protein
MIVLHQPPNLLINVGSSVVPVDFKHFITNITDHDDWHFQLKCVNGMSLPAELLFSSDGILSGMASQDTEGSYDLEFQVSDNQGKQVCSSFKLVIQPSESAAHTDLATTLQQQLAVAVGGDPQQLGIPNLNKIYNWQHKPIDIYRLAERFAYLSVWNAADPSSPGALQPLSLAGASNHYHVYDCGSCLVGSPVALYSSQRTAHDAYITARAIAVEAYNRGWDIEFSGFDKMVRAAWVQLNILSAQYNKPIKIMNYKPRREDENFLSQQINIIKDKSYNPSAN